MTLKWFPKKWNVSLSLIYSSDLQFYSFNHKLNSHQNNSSGVPPQDSTLFKHTRHRPYSALMALSLTHTHHRTNHSKSLYQTDQSQIMRSASSACIVHFLRGVHQGMANGTLCATMHTCRRRPLVIWINFFNVRVVFTHTTKLNIFWNVMGLTVIFLVISLSLVCHFRRSVST